MRRTFGRQSSKAFYMTRTNLPFPHAVIVMVTSPQTKTQSLALLAFARTNSIAAFVSRLNSNGVLGWPFAKLHSRSVVFARYCQIISWNAKGMEHRGQVTIFASTPRLK